MRAEAFAPGHITSFFAIFAQARDPPQRRGSRGAGFCIESGVRAAASTQGRKSPAPAAPSTGLPFRLEVVDNGAIVHRPETTTGALRELVRRAGRTALFPSAVRLENRYTLPLGAGFGVSGACALSATLAANEALRLGLDRADCVASAHCGEVEALSGLGDVTPQSLGGFEIRAREGAPPHGEVLTFDIPRTDVVLVSYGPRRTREFLLDTAGKQRLNATGAECVRRLLEAPSLEQCIRLGRSFAETLGLVSRRADALLKKLDPAGLASVAMLGDSVYAIGSSQMTEIAGRAAAGAFVETTRLAPEGARLL